MDGGGLGRVDWGASFQPPEAYRALSARCCGYQARPNNPRCPGWASLRRPAPGRNISNPSPSQPSIRTMFVVANEELDYPASLFNYH